HHEAHDDRNEPDLEVGRGADAVPHPGPHETGAEPIEGRAEETADPRSFRAGQLQVRLALLADRLAVDGVIAAPERRLARGAAGLALGVARVLCAVELESFRVLGHATSRTSVIEEGEAGTDYTA